MSSIKWMLAKGIKWLLHPPALHRCAVDKTSKVCPMSELTDTQIDRYTYLGSRCFAVNAKIGSFCSIADYCRIGGSSHPIGHVSTSPVFLKGRNVLHHHFSEQEPPETPVTTIEHDVWLGAGCQIKSGVTVHVGAVVGMGSIVTHDIPPYEIWAGNPARKLRDRFDEDTKQKLLESRWWEYPNEKLSEVAGRFGDSIAFLEADQ